MKIKKYDSINIVPFIDIILVLLVIVLTTATFVVKGIIPVDLSESKSSKKIKNQKKLMITIKEDGEVFFDKEQVLKEDISNELKKYEKNSLININCDKNTKFDNFVYIIDILKDDGYENLGIVTKYEQ